MRIVIGRGGAHRENSIIGGELLRASASSANAGGEILEAASAINLDIKKPMHSCVASKQPMTTSARKSAAIGTR